MSLDEKFVRNTLYEGVSHILKNGRTLDIQNPGIRFMRCLVSYMLGHSLLIVFKTPNILAASSKARKLVRNDFGPSPKVDTVPRFIYE
jgi:hypothetical protein